MSSPSHRWSSNIYVDILIIESILLSVYLLSFYLIIHYPSHYNSDKNTIWIRIIAAVLPAIFLSMKGINPNLSLKKSGVSWKFFGLWAIYLIFVISFVTASLKGITFFKGRSEIAAMFASYGLISKLKFILIISTIQVPIIWTLFWGLTRPPLIDGDANI